MNRTGLALVLFSLAPGFAGCNLIFGINEGNLGEGTGGSSQGGSGAGGNGAGASGAGGAASGGGGAGGAPTTGGGGEGGGVVSVECDPSKLGDGEAIGPDCGIFVQSAGTGTGGQSDPMGSIVTAGEMVTAGKNIYVCGTQIFTGSVRLADGSSMFGGLLCGSWQRDPTKRPTIAGDPGSAAVTVNGSGGTIRIEDVVIQSGGPVPNNASRPNAIGLAIQGAIVRIKGVQIDAPNAGEGAPAEANGVPAASGQTGSSATSNCQAAPLGGQNLCLAPDGSNLPTDGGNGGACSATNNSTGQDGKPVLGAGGPGGTWTAAAGCAQVSSLSGQNGGLGQAGMPGQFGGKLTGTDYTAAIAPPVAGRGSVGGGGGGGGARVNNTGGGGGAGGCGGEGGAGGGGGGASFAILVTNGEVHVVTSALHGNRGGTGGAGAIGQPGGQGGAGGNGLSPNNGCQGGFGGKGGMGGLGGGGAGGPSALVAATSNSVVDVDPSTKASSTVGSPGAGGGGGSFTDPNTGQQFVGASGQVGVACEALFYNEASSSWSCVTF